MPCLHGICEYIRMQFGDKPFTIEDLKYDENKKYNIHDFSPCAKNMGESSFMTCRYLRNPASLDKCALVQSVKVDGQKSKSASDIMNALNGLGFVKRTDGTAIMTDLGRRFALSKRQSPEWQAIVKRAVMMYGPFVGMLYTAIIKADSEGNFARRDIDTLGYPNSVDSVVVGGRSVLLSSGSQDDTITRTRSALLSWGVSAGIITSPYIEDAYTYAMSARWNVNSFVVNKSEFMASKPMVQNPLSYINLAKNTKSLRERGQEEVRGVTMQFEPIIKNRRLAVVYLLNKASHSNKQVDYKALCSLMKSYPETFVINESQYDAVMASELKVAFIAGLPYTINDNIVKPLSTLNEKTLLEDTPSELRATLNAILKKRAMYEI